MLDTSTHWLPTGIPTEVKQRLNILFIAKNALWDGGLHPEDGNHALYHRELRETLEEIGLKLVISQSYEALFEKPDVDFVFPMLNRGGFLNSEMLLPLLCTRHGLPYLGASPILRGLSDDKHLTKLEARARNVPTAPWAIFRRGGVVSPDGMPSADSYVIKPNASSASWGVRDAYDWDGVVHAASDIHAKGHDAIVEPFLDGSDVEVPVILVNGRPRIMPMMLFEQADPSHLRTYAEKRDLVDRSSKYQLTPFRDQAMKALIGTMTERLIEVFHPFDYGRFEFRVDPARGEVHFLEVNLNCNLWSQKVFGRSAALVGFSQTELIETIVAESLMRQGLC